MSRNDLEREMIKQLPAEARERMEEARAQSLERPVVKEKELVVRNVSLQHRTATCGNRTILGKPDGQIRMTEKEIDLMRRKGDGEFDRNFKIEGEYDPKKHGHIRK